MGGYTFNPPAQRFHQPHIYIIPIESSAYYIKRTRYIPPACALQSLHSSVFSPTLFLLYPFSPTSIPLQNYTTYNKSHI